MYISKVKLNDKEFFGTLTFSTIKNIKETMFIEFNKQVTVKEVIEGLAEFDMTFFSVFILETIYSSNKYSKEEVLQAFLNDSNLIEKFNSAYSYIYDLTNKCLPSSKVIEDYESEFEDEEDDSNSEWDFEYMEYLWSTILKRDYFWNTTPKNFFSQLDIHQKLHGSKKESNVEEI